MPQGEGKQGSRLGVHVRGDVDLVRQLRHVDLEARLDLGQDVGVLLGRDEADREALRAEAARAADAVQVLVGGHRRRVALLDLREVVVHDDVHALDINTCLLYTSDAADE